MRRRQFLTGLFTFALAATLALMTSTAQAKKSSNGTKKGDGNTFSGTVTSFSKTQIVVMGDGDKKTAKAFMIDDKTQITGEIGHNSKVTVTYTGNKATAISAAAAS